MVCKENVVSWFGNLSSYKRIDVMCTLLNMCLPFEVRYLGTCVEDLGKRDYNVLRDTEYRANNVSDLAELTNLGMTDKRTRRKLALYMALLHSCNYSCAVILYKNLSNLDFQEIRNLLNGTNFTQEDQPLEELLLLYTMALNHPAFNYEQKSTFGNTLLKLQEEEARLNIPKTGSMPFKSAQDKDSFPGCIPCVNQNDRIDPEISTNCVVPPPPMQAFQGEMPIRGNTMIAGVPPGLSIPPPGLCIPSPEQMAMHGTAGHPQYLHVGFPAVNHMQPWPGQVMMAHNQFVYHPTDVLPYPTSPLVSRQSSPSQSQSHSRSNSPTAQLQRKNNNNNNSMINNNGPPQQQQPRTSCQVAPSTSNSMTTSTSTSSSQTNITNSTALQSLSTSLPPLPSIGTNRSIPGQSQSLPPLMPSRPLAPMNNVTSYARHNNGESIQTTTSTKLQQQPPPPRLKPVLSGDTLRETGNKEMPNFKGNFQNHSNNEIRRLSDEDISKVDMSSNILNNIKSQANGLTQTPEKKLDGPSNIHPTNEIIENEIMPMENVPNDNSNAKPVTIPDQVMMNYHHQNHTVMANMRRYPPHLDPTHIQMFPAPPAMYPAQNACYGCLTTVPMAGIQNRFSRCNTPQLYCLTQLQALRLEPENSRHCSQSSSSDSTGSRSPPETPPAAPWTGMDNSVPQPNGEQPPPPQHPGAGPPPSLHSIPSSHSGPQQPMNQERPRPRKSQSHLMRHKNHSSNMVNGGAAPPQPPPTSLQPCMTFPAPPGHTPMTAYLPHHAHFPALRPTTGIYSNFTHAYARPAPAGYPTLAYQPNGEMIYQYPGHPPPGSNSAVVTATGTPPPPPAAVVAAAAAAAVQSTPNQVPPQQQQQQQSQPQQPPPQQQPQQQQNYVPTTPVVTYAPVNVPPPNAAPPPQIPSKVSCYNCGSSNHTALDCKEQTMEDITRRASYRLDYMTMKQSGSEQCQSSDK